jgi:hypothetical protein
LYLLGTKGTSQLESGDQGFIFGFVIGRGEAKAERVFMKCSLW